MKKLKTFTVLLLAATAFIFLSFAFVQWQINPQKWTQYDRGFLVLFSACAAVISAGLTEIIEK